MTDTEGSPTARRPSASGNGSADDGLAVLEQVVEGAHGH
jgi:hypothetical protein